MQCIDKNAIFAMKSERKNLKFMLQMHLKRKKRVTFCGKDIYMNQNKDFEKKYK